MSRGKRYRPRSSRNQFAPYYRHPWDDRPPSRHQGLPKRWKPGRFGQFHPQRRARKNAGPKRRGSIRWSNPNCWLQIGLAISARRRPKRR